MIRLVSAFVVAALLVVAVGVKLSRDRLAFLESGARKLETVQSALRGLPLSKAGPGEEPLSGLDEKEGARPSVEWGAFKSLQSLLRDTAGAYDALQTLSEHTFAFFEEFQVTSGDWFAWLLRGEGETLIAALERLRDHLERIDEAGTKLLAAETSLKRFLAVDPALLLGVKLDTSRVKEFLDGFLPWLKETGEHRLLVLFGNTSEMRPAGGFLGSYAEVFLRSGAVSRVVFHDVSEADRELALKVVPPKPLQAIVKSWRAADANWFLDFPTSARKILYFLERSELYRPEEVRFEGVVALTPRVIADLLTLSGPLEVSGLRLDPENFLIEIQKSVQSGREGGEAAPKRLIEALARRLIARLEQLPDAALRNLSLFFARWIAERDLLLYFRDESFARFFDAYGISGKVSTLAPDFYGDYLAVASANIGGGKSDLFVRQTVTLQSQILPDGTVTNHLVVTRAHQGDKAAYWWYRVPNQAYLKAFVGAGAELSNFGGGLEKKVVPPLNYKALGYGSDPEVAALEATRREYPRFPALEGFTESGKTVFATWARTAAGDVSELFFDYSRRLPLPPREGRVYEFVFEKQPGSRGEYQFEIHAPIGFRFRENGLPVYEYKTEHPPGRLLLRLTLEQNL